MYRTNDFVWRFPANINPSNHLWILQAYLTNWQDVAIASGTNTVFAPNSGRGFWRLRTADDGFPPQLKWP